MKIFSPLAVVAFCVLSGCSMAKKPTAKECEQLLNSKSSTRVDIADFIERSQNLLRDTHESESTNMEAERLGLCTGALIRKLDQVPQNAGIVASEAAQGRS